MTSPSQNLVGRKVRELRMKAGLSQEAFSARLQLAGWDLSRAGLSKIECGQRRVNDAEVLVLAKTLAVEMTELYPTRPKGIGKVLRQGQE